MTVRVFDPYEILAIVHTALPRPAFALHPAAVEALRAHRRGTGEHGHGSRCKGGHATPVRRFMREPDRGGAARVFSECHALLGLPMRHLF